MKKRGIKKETIIIAVVAVLFIGVSAFSMVSIRFLQGNARVVNYVGIVRGATQKLVKRELMGYADDPLIHRLDLIVQELITGEGPNELIALQDVAFQDLMAQVRVQWAGVKEEIMAVRAGAEKERLFVLSEEYFTLVDSTVTAAELHSERQVNRSLNLLLGVNAVFLALVMGGVIFFIRALAVRRRAEMLGRIAFVDPMTGMNNRASFESLAEHYAKAPPEGEALVFMFDMNNLKQVNDELGHEGGDGVITAFAHALVDAAGDGLFTARYGGDEFIAVMENGSQQAAESLLARLNERVIARNIQCVEPLEKISFAAGYAVGTLNEERTLATLINEADRAMYIRKRQMKEALRETGGISARPNPGR